MIDKSTRIAAHGAVVLSLDFELQWGVHDRTEREDPYIRNILGARQAIPRMLELFEEFEVAATWAAVGFLFARNRREMAELSPALRPSYQDRRLSSYAEVVGEDEEDDPLHYAGSLLERIRRTPRQEIATHTFSHFYAREAGQDREAFRADLRAAVEIARRWGITLRSIVFPRNQHNPAYDPTLIEMGIRAYRGNPPGYAWGFEDAAESRSPGRRGLRFLDSYAPLSGSATQPWGDVMQPSGLANIRASYPLRPYSPAGRTLEPLRLRRIGTSLGHAARDGEIFHLWWHPHNFGMHTEENLRFLRAILEEARRWRETAGMESITMAQAAERAALSRANPATADAGAGR